MSRAINTFANEILLNYKQYEPEIALDILMPAVTHLMENPSIKPPLITPTKQEEIVNFIKKTQFKIEDIPYPQPINSHFTFIDLFAGIGGFRQAFQNQGGKCVFSSEWDKFSAETYFSNYGTYPYGDIKLIPESEIPNHDILCAGFPCQPFSIAGVAKKRSMGERTGFKDKTQGTLFFEIERILRAKRPPFFFLENVKNILSHNKGKTIQIIESVFNDLEYHFEIKVVNGGNWVPQKRERVFFIGYDTRRFKFDRKDFYIACGPNTDYNYPTLDKIINSSICEETLPDGTWNALKRHKENHLAKGNGFGYKLLKQPITKDQMAWTISARYYKDGADCLVEQKGKNPRKLTVKEVLQLQGFDPTHFLIPVGKTQAYKQIGNSVIIPAVEETAKILANLIATAQELTC